MQTTTTVIEPGSRPAKAERRATLSALVIGLGVLLALQLLLALGLDLGGRGMTPAGSEGPLLVFDPEKITGIRVQPADGEPVSVEKRGSGWVIPSLGDLPAAEQKVTGLLTKLQGLQKGLPVATSEEALERFKVADKAFERKLTLERGDQPPLILYLGDSPGFRRLFVRAEGDDAVYEAELGLFDAPDKADNWSDRTLLHLDAEKVQKLTLAGLTLERKDDGWRLADVAKGEEQDEEAIKDKVRALTNIDFLRVRKGEKEPEVSKDASPVEMEVTLAGGETILYRLSKLAEGDDYLLEVSNRPQRFTLSKYMAEELTAIKRLDLLRKTDEAAESPPEEPVPVGTVESKTGKSGSSETRAETETSASAEVRKAKETIPPPLEASEAPASGPDPAIPDPTASSKPGD